MPHAEHPEYVALLRAVCAAPDDDTPRLVAADWLDEHGDPDRAAFIRAQVKLARLDLSGEGKSLESHVLRETARAYLKSLSVYRSLWAAEACPELVRVVFREDSTNPLTSIRVDGAEGIVFHRGFVERVGCDAFDWLRHGGAIRTRQPVREVHLARAYLPENPDWLRGLAALTGLRMVTLRDGTPSLLEWLRDRLSGVRVG